MTAPADTIRAFVTEAFLFGDASLLPADDGSLLEAGVLDSTDVLELVVFLEENFPIRVEDTDITPENFDSIERLAGFVESRVAVGPGAA